MTKAGTINDVAARRVRMFEIRGRKQIKVDARKASEKKAAEAILRRVSDVNSYSQNSELNRKWFS